VVLPDGAEEKWDEMIGAIRQGLSKDKEYIVNLTCGTKFMISAVPNAFEGLAATFYYIPFPKNRILKIGDTWEKEIAYRMSVREYFDCNNTSIPGDKTPDIASDYTASFFRRFVEGGLDYEVINLLRAYRGIKEMPISVIEKEGRANSPEKYPPVPGLSSFLEDIDFPSQSAGQLSKAEAQYLTGGWYEEYIYTLIQEKIQPQDILMGVELPITDKRGVSRRDLDLVFTYENKLFVVECKTGVDKEALLSETVYKAAALKNERLGKLSAHSFIFSLGGPNEIYEEIARAMGVNYYDRTYFEDGAKFGQIIEIVNRKAKG